MNKFFRYFFIATFSILILFFSAKHIYKRNVRSNVQVELRYNQNSSLTYDEAIAAYRNLDFEYREAKLIPYGTTDFGKPLHLFVISRTKIFDPVILHEKGFRVVMVNNGIHPGEPCGIDASVKLATDILSKKDSLWTYMDSTVLCIVPVYNIGGAHNRSPYNRANQNGPEMQGFRANARNLDLNRDYAPMDSRNAQTFARIFHSWKPNLLIDTHATNGADYQYIMTLVATHPQELPPMLGAYYGDVFEPYLYSQMEKRGYPMIPYVSPMGQTPDSGIQQFLNPPRYTSGYGRMFNTISFMTESHMFKDFADRVLATYQFIEASLRFTSENGSKLAALLNEANLYVSNQKEFVLAWEIDSTRSETISFMGYEAEYVDSEITGSKRLRYNRDKPYTKDIPFLRHFIPSLTIATPDFYYIPQAWREVIDRLTLNKVQLYQFEKDTILQVEAYYIQDYETYSRPQNGHYLHYNVELRTELQEVQFYSGDYIVPVNQPANQFLVEMLEPQSSDSYFVWNFFDPILQRKEYFSPYIFEDFALEMLKSNPELKEEFEQKRREDKKFASNSYAQLSFLYQRSPFFEKGFMRYPVFRSVSRSN
ncbi:MAG: M14 family zinc carboxypeptidase [Bacteroidales bacterium]|nr:M14 family zinc carboxypeptidase [Tenuifilaceae bacterium]